MPKRYPSEFRRKVLDLVASGRSVASVAEDLGVSAQTIYNLRRKDAIDRGEAPGRAGGHAPRQRTVEGPGGVPKRRFETIAVIAAEGLPVQTAARVLEVNVTVACRCDRHEEDRCEQTGQPHHDTSLRWPSPATLSVLPAHEGPSAVLPISRIRRDVRSFARFGGRGWSR